MQQNGMQVSERCDVLLGRLGGLHIHSCQDGADALVERMVFDLDRGRHPDPASGRQARSRRESARQAHERDIRLAARHDEPAGGEHALLFPAQARDLALEFDGLARVFLGLLGNIAVEQGIILVLDLDHRRGSNGSGSSMSS